MQWLVIGQLSSHSRFLDNFWLFQSAPPFFFSFFSSLSQVALAQAPSTGPIFAAEILLQDFDGQSVIFFFFCWFCVLLCFWGQVGTGISLWAGLRDEEAETLHFWLCFMGTITSGRAAVSQFSGFFSSSASERTLLLMKGENMLFAPCHFFPQLTPPLGLLECLWEPLQFIETGGINLVLAGEVNWSGWCRVEGSRDTLRWRRGHNRGVKSFLTAAWELNLRNFLPSYAFKR